jgi:preprotein translocase subunit SecG
MRHAAPEQEGKINMSLQLSAFLTLLVLSLAVPIILFLLLRDSLVDLLRHTLKVQAGITFYVRSFLLILFLSALSAAIGTSFDLKPDSRFMEYVWKGAEGVSSTLEKTLWFVAVYLVLITILVATLKIKDDK